jgi:hypothetical protein
VGEAHYAVVLAPEFEIESLIIVVDESLGEEPLVVVEPLCPFRDGFVLYLAYLLTQNAHTSVA